MCRGFSCYLVKQISCVAFLCCFAVEVVTLQNTEGFSLEEVDEIIQKQLHEKTVRIAKCV